MGPADPRREGARPATVTTMLRRACRALSIALCLAAAGCGGSATSTSTTAATAPTGWVRYEALGVSLLGPRGLSANRAPFPGLAQGTPFVRLTPGGASSAAADEEIFIIVNPHPGDPLPVVVTQLQASESANSQISHLKSTVATVAIPGARDARTVTETYTSPLSASTRTTTSFRRVFLLMTTSSGQLIDMAAAAEPQRGGALDPRVIIGSVRLAGH